MTLHPSYYRPIHAMLTRIEMSDAEAMIQPEVTEIDNSSKSETAANIEPIAQSARLMTSPKWIYES